MNYSINHNATKSAESIRVGIGLWLGLFGAPSAWVAQLLLSEPFAAYACYIATEASLFAYLLFSYFYLLSQTEQRWPPEGLPALLVPGINTAILIASSVCVWACELNLRRSQQGWSVAWMVLAQVLGICFVVVQFGEWSKKGYGIATHLYGSLYFTITGFHLAHVLVGLVVLLALLVWIALGYFDHRRYAAVTIGGMYWHFVDVVWLFVFSTLYLTPYLY